MPICFAASFRTLRITRKPHNSGPLPPPNGITDANGGPLACLLFGTAMSLKPVTFLLRSAVAAAVIAASALALSGCSDNDQMAAQYIERPIEQIYSDAWKMIDRGNWLEAGRQFDEV